MVMYVEVYALDHTWFNEIVRLRFGHIGLNNLFTFKVTFTISPHTCICLSCSLLEFDCSYHLNTEYISTGASSLLRSILMVSAYWRKKTTCSFSDICNLYHISPVGKRGCLLGVLGVCGTKVRPRLGTGRSLQPDASKKLVWLSLDVTNRSHR